MNVRDGIFFSRTKRKEEKKNLQKAVFKIKLHIRYEYIFEYNIRYEYSRIFTFIEK